MKLNCGVREFNAKKWSQRETWINTPGEFHKDSKEPLFVEIGYVGAEQSMENQGPILKKHVIVLQGGCLNGPRFFEFKTIFPRIFLFKTI